MTFASAERAYLTPPDEPTEHQDAADCGCDECYATHLEDEQIRRGEERREAGEGW